MIFQTLDTKKECAGVYVDGRIVRDHIPADLSATWKYTSELDIPATYASLYCAGQSLGDVCPPRLIEEWTKLNGKLRNYFNACNTAKVDLNQNCFYDLVPQKFLLEYCEIRNQITKHVLQNYPKPENYNFLLDLVKLLDKIRKRDIKIDPSDLSERMSKPRARTLYKKLLKQGSHRIDYDPFKSKTGRLTTRKHSFPILTLDRSFRSIIKPTNDGFVELDFNAAELRTLLSLAGKEQPDGDLHEWNAQHVYRGLVTRDEAKKRIFSWLYNPESRDYVSSRAYDRDTVVQKYYNGNQVRTFCGRTIPSDDHHALNYIVQSTTSDLFLKRAIKVDKILQGKKSNIAFLLHDSLVIDFSRDDTHMLDEIVNTFGDTELGNYVTNVSVGRDFGTMKVRQR